MIILETALSHWRQVYTQNLHYTQKTSFFQKVEKSRPFVFSIPGIKAMNSLAF